MNSKLAPIEPSEYDKVSTQEFEFPRCPHRQAKYDRQKGEIRCMCGWAVAGPRLGELAIALGIDKR